jgi:hypothetical protein
MPDSLFLIRHCLEEIWKKKEGMRKWKKLIKLIIDFMIMILILKHIL